ncbi:amidohydrolase family protein [Alkalibaculum sp. M08DMB]|uniref:Amidohydrolase family protein n=1 Tax=Alkalibaculum sporogenes TaxID=2655001 RepID=A0A6A7KE12_9FIRM|nr:amidohydrolase family protein [Alkalibaculum sporogenes]MPW27213.1 amidohydrolase family protein [Alkalibaculum sporogenes]
MYVSKKGMLEDLPELELMEFGDFVVKRDYIKNYEIIDFHCHLFQGLKDVFPRVLQKEDIDLDSSLFDKSCFPFSLKQFDINAVYFTRFPEKVRSIDGLRAKIKLITGGFVLKKASPERLMRDMKLNNICKSLVLQISDPYKNSAGCMEEIVKANEQLITFGSIHPKDRNIQSEIHKYLSFDIKGWKVNPHVMGVNVESKEFIELIKQLAITGLPILSCSGLGAPKSMIGTLLFSKKQRAELNTQRIESFYSVLREIPNTTFILAHAGLYEVDELIKLLQSFPNTYADISCQPPKSIRRLIDELGSQRLLFGTDYPFFNQSFSIVSVLRATSNEADRRNIFSKNARHILNMKN